MCLWKEKSLIYAANRVCERYRPVSNYNNWWPSAAAPGAMTSRFMWQMSESQIQKLLPKATIQLGRHTFKCSWELPWDEASHKMHLSLALARWTNKNREFIFQTVGGNFRRSFQLPLEPHQTDLSIINCETTRGIEGFDYVLGFQAGAINSKWNCTAD